MSAFINTAIKAAYFAASIIQNSSRSLSKIKVTQKNKNDFVSDIDKKAEESIITTINKAYPSHNILAEESGFVNNGSEFTWIIDPIDGTTNFIHGHPNYSISIALKEKDKIIHGVVLDPNRNDLYQASIGKGALLNEKRIRVSNNNLEHSLIATGFPTVDLTIIDKYLQIFKDITLNTTGQRRLGSAALDLAYVASGIVDGFYEYNLKTWDVAAGILLVKEAGGIVINFEGKSHFGNDGDIIAANPKIVNQLQKIIKKYL
jgi:myo-inositol-1(or 4)-monophosphatase